MSTRSTSQKLRGFIVDKSSGRPLPNVVVVLAAETKVPKTIKSKTSQIVTPLGMLVSDAAGYVSFDLNDVSNIDDAFEKLWLYAVGDEAVRIDDAKPFIVGRVRFLLSADAKLVSQGDRHINLPSIQNPDTVDWELSPYSFAVKTEVVLGEDDCQVPQPSAVAEREFRFQRLVRRYDPPLSSRAFLPPSPDVPPPPGRGALPIDVTVSPSTPAGVDIGLGELLEFSQRWYPISHSLGQIVYSLPLAPCESVNIAVIDWSRSDSLMRQDQVESQEQLLHNQTRDRTLDETIRAAVQEKQDGWSLTGGRGGAGALFIQAGVVPIDLGLTDAEGGSIAHTQGQRDVSGESLQTLHDRVIQSTFALRRLNSTVIVQSSQAEQNVVQTRTVTNHNHCHALTVQYFEVLRNFKIVTAFVQKRKVVFIPYKMISQLTWENILRFRTIIEQSLLDNKLSGCFDAIVRYRLCNGVYEEQTTGGTGTAGSGATGIIPPGKTKVSSFTLTMQTGESGTIGEVEIYLGITSSNSRRLFLKRAVNSNEMNSDGTAPFRLERNNKKSIKIESGEAIELDPAYVDAVEIRWSPATNTDDKEWTLTDVELDFTLEGEPQRRGKFDITKTNFLPTTFRSSGSTRIPATAQYSSESATTESQNKYSKNEDLCCETQLLQHLNANLGYYNRAIWLLQNSVERRLQLENALASHPEILGGLDDTPLAVSGSYVAYAYHDGNPPNAEIPDDAVPRTDIVSIPTRGLFAEAQLGHCNSCEVRDVTRFWQWDESPCEKPPTIEGITPGPKGQPLPTPQPASLPNPVVQVMQAPSAPDPIGLAAAFKVLGEQNLFRDLSGLDDVSKLLGQLASGAVTSLQDAQNLAKLAQGKLQNIQSGTSASGSGTTTRNTPSEPDAGKQIDKLNAIKYARDNLGILDDQQAKDAAAGVVGGESIQLVKGPSIVRGANQLTEGIDISHFTGAINWNLVSYSGIRFAFLRASYGTGPNKGSADEKWFIDSWDAVQSARIIRGAYHFFRPSQDAKQQVQRFVEMVGKLQQGDLPPVIDLEDDPLYQSGKTNRTASILRGGLSLDDYLDAVVVWIDEVFQYFGQRPMIYTSRDFWNRATNDSDRFVTYPLWVASWDKNLMHEPQYLPSPWADWDFWQYRGDVVSNNKIIPGIQGKVDLDWFNGSEVQLATFAGFKFDNSI